MRAQPTYRFQTLRQMRNYLLFLVLLYTATDLPAQKMTIYKGDLMLNMHAATIRDSLIIDTAKLTFRYRFSNTAQDRATWCNLLLQIGSRVVKQQDMLMYYAHLSYTNRGKNGPFAERIEQEGSCISNLFSESFCDRQTGLMTVVCGDLFDVGKMKDYPQQTPHIEWSLQPEEKQVCGYRCHRAIGTYGGREWSVWYTPEIPYAYGPWKLSGLPGMILYATDSNFFTFECMEITQGADPIKRFRYESMQHLKDLETYLRYERRAHDHPYETFAEGGTAYFYQSGPDGKLKAIDDSYKVPYIPIESY